MTTPYRVVAPTLEGLASRWPVVVFDLDGTLYDEMAYLEAAHRAIARRLAARRLASEDEVSRQLSRDRQAGRTAGVFDRAIKDLSLPAETLAMMLDELRTVDVPGGLLMHDWARKCLELLRAHGRRLFILTNGNPTQQMNKLRLLRLDQASGGPEAILGDAVGRKPSPAGLLEIARRVDRDPSQLLFIGNDEVDEACALLAGSWFARSTDVATLFRT